MQEIRCKKCNRLLMKVDSGCCVIECKCVKCGYYNQIDLPVMLELRTNRGQRRFQEIVAAQAQA